MHPLELKITAARNALAIRWSDGTDAVIAARLLRISSRAAPHVRAAIDRPGSILEDVTITAAELIGLYAVRLHFSDGHDRGIYPWNYLHEIADQMHVRASDASVPSDRNHTMPETQPHQTGSLFASSDVSR